MSENNAAPKPRVEAGAPTASASKPASAFANPTHAHGTPEASSQASEHASTASAEADHDHKGSTGFSDAVRSIRSWVSQSFPGHENAVIFGFLGFVIAILIFVIGFWRTLFITLVVVAGVAVGQKLDGDAKIINAIRKLIRDNRN